MNNNIYIYEDIYEAVNELAKKITEIINKSLNEFITVGLSGGSTPGYLFNKLSNTYNNTIAWHKIKFFWVDERCVPPDDQESNYRLAKEQLFDYIPVSNNQIFRIKGEVAPEAAKESYSNIIMNEIPQHYGTPQFDILLLGMGTDGHTASIFPNRPDILNSGNISEIALHPKSLQKRITLTGRTIINAKNKLFLVSGTNKAQALLKALIEKDEQLPVTSIAQSGKTEWYIDKAAGKLIEPKL
jgi:6-phosphogluconolactonase